MTYRGLSPQRVNERFISEHAKREAQLQFASLAHLLNRGFLKDCYNSLNRNKAVGIDGVSWKEYGEKLDNNVECLITRMKNKSYKPIPARRAYIPKNEKKKRPLGIPSMENKIVEMGITRILQSIYEEDFLECSFGFRPERNCHQAINRVDKLNDYLSCYPLPKPSIKHNLYTTVTCEVS